MHPVHLHMCEVGEENLIDVERGVDREEGCRDICRAIHGCNVYTYLGEDSHLRNDENLL